MADKTYLDREAVLDVAFQTLPLVGTSPAEAMGISRMSAAVYRALRNIPAADVVEVRHGKWVWDENGMDWGLGAWICSECHRKPETWWEADKGNPYRCAGSSYCNHCGAKMDGGDTNG